MAFQNNHSDAGKKPFFPFYSMMKSDFVEHDLIKRQKEELYDKLK